MRVYIIFVLLLLFSCKVKNENLSTRTITILDFGKTNLSEYEKTELSRNSKIRLGKLTTSIYTNKELDNSIYVLNDSRFNYKYVKLGDLQNKKCTIKYKNYKINNKSMNIIFEIDKIE